MDGMRKKAVCVVYEMEFLIRGHGVVSSGVDTRCLTKRIREKGTLLGRLLMDGTPTSSVPMVNPDLRNLVQEVSLKVIHTCNTHSTLTHTHGALFTCVAYMITGASRVQPRRSSAHHSGGLWHQVQPDPLPGPTGGACHRGALGPPSGQCRSASRVHSRTLWMDLFSSLSLCWHRISIYECKSLNAIINSVKYRSLPFCRFRRPVHQQWARRPPVLPGHHREPEEGGMYWASQAGVRCLPGTPAPLPGHRCKDLQDEVSTLLSLKSMNELPNLINMWDTQNVLWLSSVLQRAHPSRGLWQIVLHHYT